MKNVKYTVNINNIYVGTVIKADMENLFRINNGLKLPKNLSGELGIESEKKLRNILFIPDENNYSNDLLYDTPNYPILNVTDDEKIMQLLGKQILISDICNLAKLLKHFDYCESLNYEDLVRIRNIFFTGEFAINHCYLFGYNEIKDKDKSNKTNTLEVTDNSDKKRFFKENGKGILPIKYWEALDKRRNNNFFDILFGLAYEIDSFKPHIEEGYVKKLSIK